MCGNVWMFSSWPIQTLNLWCVISEETNIFPLWKPVLTSLLQLRWRACLRSFLFIVSGDIIRYFVCSGIFLLTGWRRILIVKPLNYRIVNRMSSGVDSHGRNAARTPPQNQKGLWFCAVNGSAKLGWPKTANLKRRHGGPTPVKVVMCCIDEIELSTEGTEEVQALLRQPASFAEQPPSPCNWGRQRLWRNRRTVCLSPQSEVKRQGCLLFPSCYQCWL